MSERTKGKGSRRAYGASVFGLILVLSIGGAADLAAAHAQQSSAPRPDEPVIYVGQGSFVGGGAGGSQLSQDIRIMQRIVRTALDEVEPPELPEILRDAEPSAPQAPVAFSSGGSDTPFLVLSGGRGRAYSIGSRDVNGFYMQGYGYLFTLRWRVSSADGSFAEAGLVAYRAAELSALAGQARRAAAAGQAAEARAAGDAEGGLEQEREQLEERQAAWDEWSAQYRSLLAEALRGVVAVYGSTLNRASPEESVTFIADFGGGEDETVTVSARRGDLAGASREENLAAVQISRGATGISPMLSTELKIMEEIIDSSLEGDGSGDVWVSYGGSRSFGGDSSYQFVPGYGVLFRKSARLNLATQVIRSVTTVRTEPRADVGTLRQRIDESTEEQREAYAQHLADLRQKTAEIFATYGPTLTEMNDEHWVGIFYNVGSAAGLLEGGISNFLVQARMGDIREAGRGGGATWLADRLVTNEKQD